MCLWIVYMFKLSPNKYRNRYIIKLKLILTCIIGEVQRKSGGCGTNLASLGLKLVQRGSKLGLNLYFLTESNLNLQGPRSQKIWTLNVKIGADLGRVQ